MAPTTQNTLNCGRYKTLIEVLIPRLMVQIHQWLFKGSSLKDHIETTMKMNKFDSSEKELIKKGEDINKMDVKLLYKLLQQTCDLANEDEAWYKKREDGEAWTLEKVLYKLKGYRNKSSHPDPTKVLNISDQLLDETAAELKDLFTQALNLAGKKGNINKEHIKKVREKLLADIQQHRHAEANFTMGQFITESRCEVEEQIKDKKMLAEDHYVEPRLLAEETNLPIGTRKVQEIPCKDLFVYKSRPELFILVGESGAGKTSFCQYIMRNWHLRPDVMKTLDSFHLVLYLQCIEISTRDLYDFIRVKLLPQTTESCSDAREVTKLLSKAKVLWIVDGWDEASVQAKDLVKELLSTLSEKHSVLVTSRPEMSHELPTICTNIKSSIKLYFTELSQSEREELVKKNLPGKGKVPHSVKGYISDPEISTPLQLVLVANLMTDKEISNGEKPITPTQLYTALCQHHKINLIEKYKKEVIEKCAKDIVDKFFKCVCEVAFDAVESGLNLKLNHRNIKTLKRACKSVDHTHAFSTFFKYEKHPDSSCSDTDYYFPHVSQCLFYAAHHVKHICLKANTDFEWKKLFPHVATRQSISKYSQVTEIFFDVKELVVILLSRMTYGWLSPNNYNKGFFQEMKGVIIKACNMFKVSPRKRRITRKNENIYHLITLYFLELIYASNNNNDISNRRKVNKAISYAIGDNSEPNKWFEVLRSSNYNKDLVEQISCKVNLESWHVTGRELRAARELLQYVQPNKITIAISEETQRLPELVKILHTVARTTCLVNLHFHWEHKHLNKEFSCDELLEIICNSNSKCQLHSFMGHANEKGMNHLITSSQIETLTLRITKGSTFKTLTEYAQQFNKLETLFLIYDLRKYSDPAYSLDGWNLRRILRGRIKIILEIPHLQVASVKEIKNASSMISKLTKHYDVLCVGDMSYKNVRAFVGHLDNMGVNVANFIKPVYSKATEGRRLANFGKLPLQDPIDVFIKKWVELQNLSS